MLMIHNTMTGMKEAFEPLVPGKVGMYVCGVTVYDECHLGHGRSAIVFDAIRRYLQYRGFAVNYVRNFTDVDDKIIARANQEAEDWTAIVARYIAAFARDMERLSVSVPDQEPRATEHMPEIIRMVGGLIDKGVAYVVEGPAPSPASRVGRVDGDVYYRIEGFADYGCLSHRKLDDMLAGARVEVDERKQHPMDFALWKASKPGEPAWESPWGKGRPGWHIECSAMSVAHLGETFDIHGGGEDLIFPHHENEIAQSQAFTGKPFARYWIHNGFVTIHAEKMSKSLGNTFTIRALFEASGYTEAVTAEVIRYFVLSAHYRSPIDVLDDSFQESKRALNNVYDLLLRLEEASATSSGSGEADEDIDGILAKLQSGFETAMDDDFNTPEAIGELQRVRAEINACLAKGISWTTATKAGDKLRNIGQVLGLFQIQAKAWEFGEKAAWTSELTNRSTPQMSESDIEAMIGERQTARTNKDWKRSDEIRDSLAQQGVILEDRPDGTTRWKR